MVLNRDRVFAAGAWLVAAVLGLFRPAAAAEPPPPVRLAELQAECDAAWRVKITGRQGVFEVSRPRVDSLGVVLPSSSNPPAIITIGDAKEPERRIAWSEIEQLHTERSRAMPGLAGGLVVGALMSTAMVAASGPDLESDGDNVMVFYGVLLTLLTGAAGMLLGMSNPALDPIYP